MQPLLGVYAGFSKQEEVKPGPDLEPYIKDALEEIEYCQGDASTEWGARRIKDGHPEPVPIHYVEIGNEDHYGGDAAKYARFAQYFDAIKAKYPDIKIIATTPVTGRTPDLVDAHFFRSPRVMLSMADHFDKQDPSEPKFFVGEWASRDGNVTPGLRAALSDAAWLTGLQRNSETVLMNSYAPLMTRTEPDSFQWSPDLIGHDSVISFGSPSYYVQTMVNANLGDVNLAYDLDAPKPVAPAADDVEKPQGPVGLGTENAAAEFKDLSLVQGGKTIFRSNFGQLQTKNLKSRGDGDWNTEDDALRQSNDKDGVVTRVTFGGQKATDYMVTVKARKTGGTGGLVVTFYDQGANGVRTVHFGGRNKMQASLERYDGISRSDLGDPKPLEIQTGKWYDLRIELSSPSVKCYVDGKLLLDASDLPAPPKRVIFTAASRDSATGDVIVKIVNAGITPQPIDLALVGGTVGTKVTAWELTGHPDDVNTVAEPTKVAPKLIQLTAAEAIKHTVPANSFTILRFAAKK